MHDLRKPLRAEEHSWDERIVKKRGRFTVPRIIFEKVLIVG
jgi:hypothetical protein